MVSLSHGGCNVTGITVSERKRSDKAAGERSMEPAEGRQGADEAWPRRLHRAPSGLASPPSKSCLRRPAAILWPRSATRLYGNPGGLPFPLYGTEPPHLGSSL